MQAHSAAGSCVGSRGLSTTRRALPFRPPRRQLLVWVADGGGSAAAGATSSPSAAAAAASSPSAAAGTGVGTCSLVRLTLRKPVGLVFEQKPEGGPVYVAEVVEGGAAFRTGKVQPGDILSKCSAVVLKAGKEGLYEAEGYGQRPYDNWEVIEYDCEGKDFKTVMTALRSNNERWGKTDMTPVLRKP